MKPKASIFFPQSYTYFPPKKAGTKYLLKSELIFGRTGLGKVFLGNLSLGVGVNFKNTRWPCLLLHML